jgi:hypothetical protein
MSELTVSTRTVETRPWVRGASSRAEGDPPHFTGTDPRHPNELGVIWSDETHTWAVAFVDWDGCRADVYRHVAVLTAAQTANQGSETPDPNTNGDSAG